MSPEKRLHLYDDPQFLKMKEELERYRMREEQINSLVEKKIQEALDDFLDRGEVIEQNNRYKIVKIYK